MKFINKIRSLGQKTKVAVAAVLLTAAVAIPFAVQAEFYPDRPVFDYNKYSGNDDCTDPTNIATQNGRCGSLNGPVFNSFVNTPSYGDERAFFDGRRSDMATNTNADDIANVTEGSKEVVLRTYVHNNANQNTNDTNGVAHNAQVRIALPTAEEQVLRARSYISANNAALVEDTADLIGNRKFRVEYVPQSAKLMRGTNTYPLNDSIVTTGAPIGDTSMNGELPGCFEYAALVEIRVRIIPEQVPDMELTKQVRKHVDGQTGGWVSEVSAKPGEQVDWLINTKNSGEAALTNVSTRDVLPPHVQLVPGSIKFMSAATGTQPLNDTSLFGAAGVNSGRYNPNDNSLIVLTTTVLGDFSECQTRLRNAAFAHSSEYPTEIRDDADVVVTKDNCVPPATYACEGLKAEVVSGRTIKYTATASATGGATIQRYIYNFGDGSQELSTDQSVVTYTYPKDGQFVARVKVQVRVNGETKFAESDKCAVPVTFKQGQPPVVTASTRPTKLPEAGAGDVVAMFIAVTATSSIGYFFVSRRALGL